MYIAIEGCIGAGKTTTARLVAQRLGARFEQEISDRHPFLEKFYSDVPKYAFETELAFVVLHFHQLRHLDSDSVVVGDFSLEKDIIFARMNLPPDEFAVFQKLYKSLRERVLSPTLTIILDVPHAELSRRIRERGRPYEVCMPAEYLGSLSAHYRESKDELWSLPIVVPVDSSENQMQVADRVCDIINHRRSH